MPQYASPAAFSIHNIFDFSDKNAGDVNLAGGKGLNFHRLKALNESLKSKGSLDSELNIPDGYIISTEVFDKLILRQECIQSNIGEIKRLSGLLKGSRLDKKDSIEAELNRLSLSIQEDIIKTEIPQNIKNKLSIVFKKLGGELAIRSSATIEDGENFSCAGQAKSIINVINEDKMLDAVKQVWASLYSYDFIIYRNGNSIPHDSSKMAVIVQRVVNAQASGVVLSMDSQENRPAFTIAANFGLGESTVDGRTITDKWLVGLDALHILEKTVGNKNKMAVKDETGGVKEISTPKNSVKAALNDDDVLKLAEVAKTIRTYYQSEIGVNHINTEFAIEKGSGIIYIVQTRPLIISDAREKTVIKTVNLNHARETESVSFEKGIIANKGAVTGRLQVIEDPEGYNGVDEGVILVTSFTTARWNRAFGKIKAVITDFGDLGCHAARASKEPWCSIVSLVGALDAMQLLRKFDGQIVTFDAGLRKVFIGEIPLEDFEIDTSLWIELPPEKKKVAPVKVTSWDTVKDHPNAMPDFEGHWFGRPKIPYSYFQLDYYEEAFDLINHPGSLFHLEDDLFVEERSVGIDQRVKIKDKMLFIEIREGDVDTIGNFMSNLNIAGFEHLMDERWNTVVSTEHFINSLSDLNAGNVEEAVERLSGILVWSTIIHWLQGVFNHRFVKPQVKWLSDEGKYSYGEMVGEFALLKFYPERTRSIASDKRKELLVIAETIKADSESLRLLQNREFKALKEKGSDAFIRVEELSKKYKLQTEDIRKISDTEEYLEIILKDLIDTQITLDELVVYSEPYLDFTGSSDHDLLASGLLANIAKDDADLLLIMQGYARQEGIDLSEASKRIVAEGKSRRDKKQAILRMLESYPNLKKIMAIGRHNEIMRNDMHDIIIRLQRTIAPLMIEIAKRYPDIFNEPEQIFDISTDELVALLQDKGAAQYLPKTFDRQKLMESAERFVEAGWDADRQQALAEYAERMKSVIDVLDKQIELAKNHERVRQYYQKLKDNIGKRVNHLKDIADKKHAEEFRQEIYRRFDKLVKEGKITWDYTQVKWRSVDPEKTVEDSDFLANFNPGLDTPYGSLPEGIPEEVRKCPFCVRNYAIDYLKLPNELMLVDFEETAGIPFRLYCSQKPFFNRNMYVVAKEHVEGVGLEGMKVMTRIFNTYFPGMRGNFGAGRYAAHQHIHVYDTAFPIERHEREWLINRQDLKIGIVKGYLPAVYFVVESKDLDLLATKSHWLMEMVKTCGYLPASVFAPYQVYILPQRCVNISDDYPQYLDALKEKSVERGLCKRERKIGNVERAGIFLCRGHEGMYSGLTREVFNRIIQDSGVSQDDEKLKSVIDEIKRSAGEKNLSRGNVDERQDMHAALDKAANEGRLFAVMPEEVQHLWSMDDETLTDLLMKNLADARAPPETRNRILVKLKDLLFRENLLKGFDIMAEAARETNLSKDQPMRFCIVLEDKTLPTLVFNDLHSNLLAHSGKGVKSGLPYKSIYIGYNSLDLAVTLGRELELKSVVLHEARDITRGYHVEDSEQSVAHFYDDVVKIFYSDLQAKRKFIFNKLNRLGKMKRMDFVEHVASYVNGDVEEQSYLLDYMWRNDKDVDVRKKALKSLYELAWLNKKLPSFMPFRSRFYRSSWHEKMVPLMGNAIKRETCFEPLEGIKDKSSIKKILLVKKDGPAKKMGSNLHFRAFAKLKKVFPDADISIFSMYPDLFKDLGMSNVADFGGEYDLVIDIDNEKEVSQELLNKQRDAKKYYLFYSFRPPLYELTPFEPIGIFHDFTNDDLGVDGRYVLNTANELSLNCYGRVMKSIKGLGLETSDRVPLIKIDEERRQSALNILRKIGCVYLLGSGRFLKPLIFFDPNCGSRQGLKDWSDEDSVKFIQELAKKHDAYILVNSGNVEEETGRIASIASAAKERVGAEKANRIFIVPQMPLGGYAAFLSCIDIGVSFDTGTSHLLGALGKPSVVIFNLSYDTMSWQALGQNTFSCSARSGEMLTYKRFLELAPENEKKRYAKGDGWVSVRIPRINRWEPSKEPEFEESERVEPEAAVSLVSALLDLHENNFSDLFEDGVSAETASAAAKRVMNAMRDLISSGYDINDKPSREKALDMAALGIEKLLKKEYAYLVYYDRKLILENIENMTIVKDVLDNSNLSKFLNIAQAIGAKKEKMNAELLSSLLLPGVANDGILAVFETIFNDPFIRSRDICEKFNMDKSELLHIYRYIQNNPLMQDMLIKRSPYSQYANILGSVCVEDRDFWQSVFDGIDRFPVEVEFHPSLWCNLDCKYCYSHDISYASTKYYENIQAISTEEKRIKTKNIIRELASGGTKRIFVSGGKEPLADALTADIIKTAHDSGLETVLNTNGVNLDGRGVRAKNGRPITDIGELEVTTDVGGKEKYLGSDVLKFYLENTTKIRISLDFLRAGFKEVYNETKGLNSDDPSFDRILENIKNMAALKRSMKNQGAIIEVALLVIEENASHLKKIAAQCKNIGIDSLVIRHETSSILKKEAYSPANIMAELQEIARIYESDSNFKVRINFEDFIADTSKMGEATHEQSHRCWRVEYKTVINPFGVGIACCYTAHPGQEKIWGQNFILDEKLSVFDYDTFKKYWTSDNVKKRRQNEIAPAKCLACLLPDRALNQAVAKVKDDLEFGILLEKQPFVRSSLLNVSETQENWGKFLGNLKTQTIIDKDLSAAESNVVKGIIKEELGEDLSPRDAVSLNKLVHILTNSLVLTSKEIAEELDLNRDELIRFYRIIQRSPSLQQVLESALPTYIADYKQVTGVQRDFWKDVFSGGNPLPFDVEFHPSLYCGLKCAYCPNFTVRGSKYKEQDYGPPFEKIVREVRELKNSGELRARLRGHFRELRAVGGEWVIVSGGMEPVEDSFSIDILDEGRAAGFNTRLVTTGIKLTNLLFLKKFNGSKERLFDFLLTHVDDLQISLDFDNRDEYLRAKGLKESNPKAFDDVVANVRALTERKAELIRRGYEMADSTKIGKNNLEPPDPDNPRLATISLAPLVLKSNYDKFERLADFCFQLGVDRMKVRRLKHETFDIEYELTDDEERVALESLRRAEEKYAGTRFLVFVRWDDFIVGYKKFLGCQSSTCWQSMRKVFVNPVGVGLACVYSSYPGFEKTKEQDFKLGNLFRFKTFRDFWDANKSARYKIIPTICRHHSCVGDRSYNDYVEKIKQDLEWGVNIEDQPLSAAPDRLDPNVGVKQLYSDTLFGIPSDGDIDIQNIDVEREASNASINSAEQENKDSIMLSKELKTMLADSIKIIENVNSSELEQKDANEKLESLIEIARSHIMYIEKTVKGRQVRNDEINALLQELKAGKFKLKGESVEILSVARENARTIGTIDRKIAETLGYVHQTANVIFVTPNGEILLQLRNKSNFDDHLAMIGGHLKAGENHLQGAITEASEETGLDISGDDLTFIGYEYYDASFDPNKEKRSWYVKKLSLEEYRAMKRKLEEQVDSVSASKLTNSRAQVKEKLKSLWDEGKGEVLGYYPVALKDIEKANTGKSEEKGPYKDRSVRYLPIEDTFNGETESIDAFFFPDSLDRLIDNQGIVNNLKRVMKGLAPIIDIADLKRQNFTFAILKPDVTDEMREQILEDIRTNGFEIVYIGNPRRYIKKEAEKHYMEHKGKPFYEGLVQYIISDEVIPLILRKTDSRNAIEEFKKLLGKSDGTELNTLRNRYGVSIVSYKRGINIQYNKIHASDSMPIVLREASLIFTDEELKNIFDEDIYLLIKEKLSLQDDGILKGSIGIDDLLKSLTLLQKEI